MWCTWDNWKLAFLTPILQAGPREVPISLPSSYLIWGCLGTATDGCPLCCFPYSQGKPWGAESADIKGLHLAEHSPECKQTRSDALFLFNRQLPKESVAFQHMHANTTIWTEIKFLEHCRFFFIIIKKRGISGLGQGKEVTLYCSSANQLLTRVGGRHLSVFLKASPESLLLYFQGTYCMD